MPPEAYICHRTSERLRVRVPSMKGNRDYFALLSARFSRGLGRAEVNPVTGSVLFMPATDPEAIIDYAAKNGLFVLKDPGSPPMPLSQKVVEEVRHLNDRIRGFTSGQIDIASVAFLYLVGAGIYQLSSGNFVTPAWYTAFWYAASISLKAHDGQRSSIQENG